MIIDRLESSLDPCLGRFVAEVASAKVALQLVGSRALPTRSIRRCSYHFFFKPERAGHIEMSRCHSQHNSTQNTVKLVLARAVCSGGEISIAFTSPEQDVLESTIRHPSLHSPKPPPNPALRRHISIQTHSLPDSPRMASLPGW